MKLIPLTQDESDAIETAFLKAYAAYRALSASGEPRLFSLLMEAELCKLWVWSRMDFSSPDQMSRVFVLLQHLVDDAHSGVDAISVLRCKDTHRAALQSLFELLSDCIGCLHGTVDACADREANKVIT